MMMSLLADLAIPSAFRARWPNVDTTRWPGRELHWMWCHPIVCAAIVLIPIIVNRIQGA
jgi:hypothetical protein